MARSHWGLVASLLRPHRRAVTVYGLVLGAATCLPLLAALLLARFVQNVVDGAGFARSAPLAGGYAACGLVASALSILVTWRATKLAWLITDDLRHELAHLVLHADLAFHRDHGPGELLSRADADVTAMTQFLSVVVARVVAIVALALAAVVTLSVIEPVLAPALAVGLIAIGLVTWRARDATTAATIAERAAEAEVMGRAEQYLAGAEDLASLGAANHVVGRFAVAVDRQVRAVGRRVWRQMQVQGSIRVTIAVAEALMLAAGAWATQRGLTNLGGAVLGYRFVAAVKGPVDGLTWRLQDAQGAVGSASRVLDLVQQGRVVARGSARLPAGPLDIRLAGAALVYDDADGESAALQPLDLMVPAGRSLGLLGRSGSGKTSIARLVLRLVAPTAGSVSLGGVDLATVDEADLRRRVVAVPQDVQLFPGTVADNVTLFADYPADEITAALSAVGLGRWLAELPDGLASRVGAVSPSGQSDAGQAGLSSGEAQLLALARTLLRRPDVVVLDEATSRIDPATQERISGATAALVEGRTALVIAHRLETLERCDDIAVLADGRLLEHGPRLQLAADPLSHYRRLLDLGGDDDLLSETAEVADVA